MSSNPSNPNVLKYEMTCGPHGRVIYDEATQEIVVYMNSTEVLRESITDMVQQVVATGVSVEEATSTVISTNFIDALGMFVCRAMQLPTDALRKLLHIQDLLTSTDGINSATSSNKTPDEELN